MWRIHQATNSFQHFVLNLRNQRGGRCYCRADVITELPFPPLPILEKQANTQNDRWACHIITALWYKINPYLHDHKDKAESVLTCISLCGWKHSPSTLVRVHQWHPLRAHTIPCPCHAKGRGQDHNHLVDASRPSPCCPPCPGGSQSPLPWSEPFGRPLILQPASFWLMVGAVRALIVVHFSDCHSHHEADAASSEGLD